VRDALYEDMPLSVRRGLHAQAAAALTAAARPPERVAEHLLRGARPGDERTAAQLAAAARDLAARAPGAAVDLYRHAIALAPDPATARARLLPQLAESLVAAGALGEAEAACREALAGPGEGRLRLHLMFLLLRRSRAAEAVRVGEESEAPDPRVSALLAMARVFAGDVERGAAGARAVLSAPGDEVAAALAANALAMAAEADGAFAEAAELIAPNVAWAERTGSRAAHDTRPHMIRGLMLTRLDRLEEAHVTIQRGRHSAEVLGLADAVATYHYQLAFVDFVRGRLDDALAELVTHEELSEQTASGWRVPAASLRALIELHRDDLLAAERHVAEAAREAAAGAPPHGSELLALARARLAEAAGDRAGAADLLAAAIAGMSAGRLAVVGPELARLAGAPVPDVAAALAAVAARNPGARSLQAAALRARGDPAGALLKLRGTGRLLETARAAEDAGEPAEARALYARCHATRDVARLDAALRAAGARRGATGPRRRPASGWDALTDTELKVVRLVAERLTNPEIAARMFISRRTVQTHVSHALAKLGAGSRRDLAAAAAREAGWRLRLDGVAEQPQQLQPAGEGPGRPALDADDA
jgi:DNA-binding CsgD family transcriptional regulator